VNERFVEVKDEGLPAAELACLRRNDCVLLRHGLLAESTCTRKLVQLFLCERELAFHDHLGCLGGDLALAAAALARLLLRLLLGASTLPAAVPVCVLNNDLVVGLRGHRASFFGRAGSLAHAHRVLVARVSTAHLVIWGLLNGVLVLC